MTEQPAAGLYSSSVFFYVSECGGSTRVLVSALEVPVPAESFFYPLSLSQLKAPPPPIQIDSLTSEVSTGRTTVFVLNVSVSTVSSSSWDLIH